MGKLFLMILNTMRSGSGTMPVPMKDRGAMIGHATSTGQGTLRGEGRTCRTSRTEMRLLGRVSMVPRLHLGRVSMAPRLHLAITRCHPTMVRATCLHRRNNHLAVVARQTTSPRCQTHRRATTLAVLLTTSKVVLLVTKADLRGIKAVTKVTKGTQARPTKVVTLATKVAHQVTLAATRHLPTKEATPTHRHTRAEATPATLVAAQVKEATRTTNEHDHEYKQAPLFQ